MEEDTWGAWAVLGIVGFLLGVGVYLVADVATQHASGRAGFLGAVSGIAFVTLGLRR